MELLGQNSSDSTRLPAPTWMHSSRLGEPSSGARARRNSRGAPADTEVSNKFKVSPTASFQPPAPFLKAYSRASWTFAERNGVSVMFYFSTKKGKGQLKKQLQLSFSVEVYVDDCVVCLLIVKGVPMTLKFDIFGPHSSVKQRNNIPLPRLLEAHIPA